MKKFSLAFALVAAFSFGCGSTTETSTPTGTDTDGGATPAADSGSTPTADAGTTPTPTTDAGTTPTPATDAGSSTCTSKTYTNFGQAFFASKCNNCHSSQRPTLTTLAAIKTNITRVKLDITIGTMPQGTRLSATEKADVMEWLNCGAP